MIVISTNDFRANQSKYLDMANNGENLVIKSRNKGSFRLVPVIIEEPDTKQARFEADMRQAFMEVRDHLKGKIKLKTLK